MNSSINIERKNIVCNIRNYVLQLCVIKTTLLCCGFRNSPVMFTLNNITYCILVSIASNQYDSITQHFFILSVV